MANAKDQLFKICMDLISFNWKTSDDVSMHIAKLRNLWNELNNGLKANNKNTLPDLICKIWYVRFYIFCPVSSKHSSQVG